MLMNDVSISYLCFLLIFASTTRTISPCIKKMRGCNEQFDRRIESYTPIEDDWRVYLIKKNKKGNYLHFKIEGKGKTIKELEKNEKIDKNLLRYLTVKVKKFDLNKNYFSKNDGDTKKLNEEK